MRLTALIPIVCSLAALILSFLCLFAGHKEGFMEDYPLMTLNTSMIGQTLFTSDSSPSEDQSTLDSLLNYIPDSITDSITSTINDGIGAVASRLGIQDFYSAHMLNYCYGEYELDPDTQEELENQDTNANNATLVDDADVSKNTTGCSASRAMYKFDPTAIIRNALAKTGLDITLDDLDWPDDIQTGIDALNVLMNAMFVLYILSIVLIFLVLLASIAALVMDTGRVSACVNFLLALLAFLASGLASALVTAVIVKAVALINEHGNDVGVEASRGGKFLALTWAATGLVFVVVLAWVVEFCMGRRRRGREVRYAKHG